MFNFEAEAIAIEKDFAAEAIEKDFEACSILNMNFRECFNHSKFRQLLRG